MNAHIWKQNLYVFIFYFKIAILHRSELIIHKWRINQFIWTLKSGPDVL
jgi:hypothetical protein